MFWATRGSSHDKFDGDESFEAASTGSLTSGPSDAKPYASGTSGASLLRQTPAKSSGDSSLTGEESVVDPALRSAQQALRKRREDCMEYEQFCQDLVCHVNHLTVDALLKATRDSLDALRKCLFFVSRYVELRSVLCVIRD